jgi:hypothetical protein
MGARNMNGKKKDKRRRHAKARKASAAAAAVTSEGRSQPRRPSAQPGNR